MSKPETWPQKVGFYWGKTTEDFLWFNLIIQVSGDSPYLKARAWNLLGASATKIDPGDVTWGPEIVQPKGD